MRNKPEINFTIQIKFVPLQYNNKNEYGTN